jgi:hypothetical protein
VAWWHSIGGVTFVPAGLVFLGSTLMFWFPLQVFLAGRCG